MSIVLVVNDLFRFNAECYIEAMYGFFHDFVVVLVPEFCAGVPPGKVIPSVIIWVLYFDSSGAAVLCA